MSTPTPRPIPTAAREDDTLNRWKRAHPDFRASVKRGKIVADFEVTNRLYTRACGYGTRKREENHGWTLMDTDGKLEEIRPTRRFCARPFGNPF